MRKIYTILITLSFIFINTSFANDKNVIGVLLPTSGQNKAIGKMVKRAVIMSGFKYSDANTVIKFYDTESSNTGAENAYKQAIKDKAKIIVGPISSSNTNTVRSNQIYGVPILSLSNNSDSASSGVFVTGFTPQSQGFGIARIIKYLNLQSVIAIIPQNKFGDMVEAGLSSSQYGTIRNVYYYDPSKYDYADMVKQIVKDRDYYNYDGIIIPDNNPKNVKIISSQLSYYDALDTDDKSKKIFLIGGLGWQKVGTVYKEPGLLNGYYLATPKSEKLNNFKQEYKSMYRITPPAIAVLAYDMTALAINAVNGESVEQKVIQENGFKGISGKFKMSSYGVVQRVYDINKVYRDRTKKILQVKTNSH